LSKDNISKYFIIFLVILMILLSYISIIWFGYDNPIEQLTENLIKMFWGVSLDLTPQNN